jgi:hypothetical protein
MMKGAPVSGLSWRCLHCGTLTAPSWSQMYLNARVEVLPSFLRVGKRKM